MPVNRESPVRMILARLGNSDRVRQRMLLWTGVVAAELAVVMLYLQVAGTQVTQVRYLLYPLIWINVGVWAVMTAKPIPASRGLTALAATIAGVYLVTLLAIPGKVGLAGAGAAVDGIRIAWLVPGWGPLVAMDGPLIRAYLVPFEVIGYGAIAYLLYANLLTVSRSSFAGVFGVVTCVGCTVPLLVPVLGLLGGTGASLASTATAWSYDIGTAIFLGVILLLYRTHRPR